jgi:hypothetical protein
VAGAAHGSQASRRDRGRGGAEYEEDPCACAGGRGHRGVSTAVEKGGGTVSSTGIGGRGGGAE